MQKTTPQSPTLTLLSALRYGFETVGAQPLLILLPIVFDLFFWLGPRMTIEPALTQLLNTFNDPAVTVSLSADDRATFEQQIAGARPIALEFGREFNAFALRPMFPFGIPSLFDTLHPNGTPIPASVTAVDDFSAIVFPALTMTIIGHLGVSLYFALVAYQVKYKRLDFAAIFAGLPKQIASLAILLVINTIIYIGLCIALAIISSFFVLIGFTAIVPILETLLLGYSAVSCLWTFILFIDEESRPIDAMRRSLKLLRQRLNSLSTLALVIFIISLGLGFFWGRVSSDSWAMLISIIGQAIVSTGLVVSAFAYCRTLYLETQPQPTAASV